MDKKKFFFICLILIMSLSVISAEEVMWDNDTNIRIYDSWEDENGKPLSSASCNWYVYHDNGSMIREGSICVTGDESTTVYWDNDSEISIYDKWVDEKGDPLTDADCNWYIYNIDDTLNQSGNGSLDSEGVLSFNASKMGKIGLYDMLINCTKDNLHGISTKDKLQIEDTVSSDVKTKEYQMNETIQTNFKTKGTLTFNINRIEKTGKYPLSINCTRNGYKGTSSKDLLHIVDELPEGYKRRLEQINETTEETSNTTDKIKETTDKIYDSVSGNVKDTLSTIENTTNMTHNETISIGNDIRENYNRLNSIRDYVEEKWGKEEADDIMDQLNDMDSKLVYLQSRYDKLTPEEINEYLKSIKKDSRSIMEKLYGDGSIDWENIFEFIIPIGAFAAVFFIIIYVINKENKNKKRKKNG